MTVNWEILLDPIMIGRLVLQVFLFIASGVFSMSETGMFSLRENDLQKLEDSHHPRASKIRQLLDQPRRLIVSIICGNELINIAATVNLTGIFLALFGDPNTAGIVNTVIMLPLLLILSEITPKTLAVTNPVVMVTRIIEPVLTIWVRLVMPLRYVIHTASDFVFHLIIREEHDDNNILSEDTLKQMLQEIADEGVLDAAERRLIGNLIGAGSTDVTQIMVPRPRIAFVDGDLPVPEIIAEFRRIRHRRLPVFRKHYDNIIGVLKENRVLEVVSKKKLEKITLDDLLEPATFVPTTQTINDLADYFKEGDHHAAIVIDEYGGVEGLVTADDVFGFLTTGEGVYLDFEADIREVETGVFLCRGLTPLRTVRQVTALPLEDDTSAATIAGLVLAMFRRLPDEGEETTDAGMTFRVEKRDNLAIREVLIAPEGHAYLAGHQEPAQTTEAAT